MLKKLLQEPLLHFLVLGAGIFAVYHFVSSGNANKPGQIVVTQGRIDALITGFTGTWQRPPTRSELDGLIRDYVREEVCVRQAVALGLDKDDMVIRRRLQQKLQFVSEDLISQVEPTDDQLRKYFQTHPDMFRSETRFTFRQVYLDPQRHKDMGGDVVRLLDQLRGRGEAKEFGDPTLLDHEFGSITVSDVARQFGDKFATKMTALSVGQWQGPIESAFGVHLICVTDRKEGRLPQFEEVTAAVRREWTNAQRQEANNKFYKSLVSHYVVTIEKPEVTKPINPTLATRTK
jgi:hypothetical protein